MIEACERRILEFPVGMDAREVAKELKREGWYAWATPLDHIGVSSMGSRRRLGWPVDRGAGRIGCCEDGHLRFRADLPGRDSRDPCSSRIAEIGRAHV